MPHLHVERDSNWGNLAVKFGRLLGMWYNVTRLEDYSRNQSDWLRVVSYAVWSHNYHYP
jgi:hypothetical protein